MSASEFNRDNSSNSDESWLFISTQRFKHIGLSSTATFSIDRDGFRSIRECSVCLMSRSSSDYYARLSAGCRHTDRTVCYECVYHHMITILGNNISAPIICPERECRTRFSTDDVRQLLMYYDNNTLLDKYDIYLTNLLLDDMPEFIWCAYGCGSGQLHLSYSSIVVCIYCHRATCFFHRIPWHENITCEEYDALGLSNDPMSTKYLEIFSKQCPKCKVRIEKIDGCDHMTCTRCEVEFCWDCLAIFGPADSLNTCQHQNSCINFQRRIIYPFVPRRRRRLAQLLHRCPIS